MLDVLIVDDKRAVLNGLKEMIPWSELDARIIGTASNGRDAFDIAMIERPDMIITDIRMPIMDGLQLCEAIYREMPHTTKVILSAYKDFEYAQTAIRFGVKDYILKPIDYEKIDVLTHKINQISMNKKTLKTVHYMLSDPLLQVKLHAFLEEGDIGALKPYFVFEASSGNAEQDDLLKNYYYKLYLILLDFAERTGIKLNGVGMANESSQSAMPQLNNWSAVKEFATRLYPQIAEMAKARKNPHTEAIIEAIKAYLQEHFANPDLSLNRIADKMNLPTNSLGLMFHQYTGDHISSYITNLRMEKAKILLKDPRLSVQQITAQVGYTDSHYFARTFKKAEGFTATQYRNLQLNMKDQLEL